MDIGTQGRILTKLSRSKRGSVVFPGDFNDTGSPEAVRKALSRLEKEGYLQRMAKGIYFVPQVDPVLGVLYPSTEEIAQQIARRDKARILPTGLYALNRLGLSTQVPLKVTFLTDGSPRKLKVGKRLIAFKATSPKKLAVKGPISGLIIQALQELGVHAVTADIKNRLQTLLAKEDEKNIIHDANLAPAWIRQLLQTLQPTTI
jgi:hypothetical protein